jgi:tetratricopeptide (TPR) repeat protein
VTIILGYDPTTLREKVDLQAARARLDELGELRNLESLNEKATLLRLVGRLDDALGIANEAVRQCRFRGDREELLRARIRRAQVQHFMGKLDAALIEFSDCVVEAHAHDWASTEAFALQHRGKVLFDQQEYAAALRDFRGALTIRVRIKASSEQVDSSMIAIAVAESFLDGDGA